MSIPPRDTNGELRRAMLALERCRREITEKSGLPPEWQRWVAESLRDSLALEEQDIEQE